MRRFVSIAARAVSALCLFGFAGARAEGPAAAPAFNELFEVVRTHLRGVTPAELDRAAADGFLAALAPRVEWVTNAASPSSAGSLAQVRVFEGNVGYLRVGRVAPALAQAVAQAHEQFTRTGKVVGLVLDLRYAGGSDFAAATDVVALFLKSGKPLLDLGDGAAKVEPAAQRVSLPVAVLVNRETVGAAEALAAALREAGVGLILGSQTAGAGAIMQEFTLKNGQKLRIATTPVKLASGRALSPEGVLPDIEVAVSREEEKAFFGDPYGERMRLAAGDSDSSGTNAPAGTNRLTRRPRPTEADLVRARRDGVPLDSELVLGREPEPVAPVLRDSALARAVDLLKGLAVVLRPGD